MSTTRRSPDHAIRRLPAEICILILELSPGFSALWSMSQAIRGFAAAFDDHAVQIVEAVMRNTVPSATREYLRAVLYMRLSSFRCSSLTKARDLQYSIADSSLISPGEAGLDAVRGFVRLAHKIHVLAHEGIEHYLEKTLAIKPSRFHECWLDRANPKIFPEGEKYQPLNVGRPSAAEEKTVLLSLWRLQYRLELLNALRGGLLGWDPSDITALKSSNALEFYGHVRSWEREQIVTMSEFMERMEDGGPARSRLPNPIVTNRFDFDCSNDCPDDSAESSLSAKKAPVAWRMVAWMSSDIKLSPMPGITYAAFREFGFILWDEKRMVGLGLYPAEKTIPGRPYYLRWLSILSDPNAAAVPRIEHGSLRT